MDMNKRIEAAHEILINTQRLLSEDPLNVGLMEDEVKGACEYRKLLKYQFIYNCKRARFNWAKEGDLNSQYFYNVVKGRRKANKIFSNVLIDGGVSFDENVIKG